MNRCAVFRIILLNLCDIFTYRKTRALDGEPSNREQLTRHRWHLKAKRGLQAWD